jgi:superfamily II DNA helicase RecQ
MPMPSSASRPFGLCNSSECILRVKPLAHATSSNRVINAVMDSRDVLWVAPTGGGKSLAYQLPAYLGSGVTIVVEPNIAIMDQQVHILKKRHSMSIVLYALSSEPHDDYAVKAETFHSKLDAGQKSDIMRKLQIMPSSPRKNNIQLLFIAVRDLAPVIIHATHTLRT